ncbi:MAG: alpha/beta hydrolase [Muribaculaceae bacterium]|nr:alpha/beta hydrolase [Muribaculaceae bacterium]
MRRIIFGMAAAASFVTAVAAERLEIDLWPDGAPLSNGLQGDDDRAILYVFPAERPTGRMVIACPGGGYQRLAMGHEGFDMAEWMNRQGITYAVLKYRMPNTRSTVPLDDTRRAIGVAREKAAEWGVDTGKIGIMGASAGGHCAAMLATMYGDSLYRPDFQILFYPVISMTDITHKGSRDSLLGADAGEEAVTQYSLENRVTTSTPPAFIMLSADDMIVSPANSLNYATSLMNCGVPVSLHMYPSGGHGWGFRDGFMYKRQWTGELEKWIADLDRK